MNKVTVLVGVTVLAVLAGCVKKEAPQAQQEDDEDGGATTTGVQAAPAQPVVKERSKAAAEMLAFIDPSPQCQQYRDELQTTGSTPGAVDELNEIFAQAYQNGCGKKKQPKQQ
jgi:hypothetical protein